MTGPDGVSFSSVRFRNVKTLRDFSISLRPMNVAVGPNNSGKSTIVGAFRVLAAGLTTARAKTPERIGSTLRRGWRIPELAIPISMENIHTDYEEVESSVTFQLSNGNALELSFPQAGGAILFVGGESKQVDRPSDFRLNYPVEVSVIPELGPVEHEEEVVLEVTVRRGLNTHRASRHFRNYWRYFPDNFDGFREDLQRTWPGVDIEAPRLENPLDTKLTMFAREGRYIRELYWAGFGFQVWCQLLTHLRRASGSSLIVVDEPETYLHPNLQRQVLRLLRDSGSEVFVATHSSEIVAEAEPSEILIVDRSRKSARRAGDIRGVQTALDHIGSARNVVLTQLARTSSTMLVEGDDFSLVRTLARSLDLSGLSSGAAIAPFPLEGFPTVERVRSIRDAIRQALGPDVFVAAVFDRDYRCDEEVEELRSLFRRHVDIVHILDQHEIENYLLSPATVDRALSRAWKVNHGNAPPPPGATDLLSRAAERLKPEVIAGRGAERHRFVRSSGTSVLSANRVAIAEVDAAWGSLDGRLGMVPGKELLSEVNRLLQPDGVELSFQALANSVAATDIAGDLSRFLTLVERRLVKAGASRS